MIERRPNIAVIGSGYWGKNLVRNFHELGALACVCDTRPEVLAQVRNDYKVHTACDFDAILE